jgi:hypothetical protein
MVDPPLAVELALKRPQAPAVPQVADQLIGCPAGVSVAISVAVAPSANEAGGAAVNLTVVTAAVVMVAVAMDDTAGFVTDVAVIVTVPPAGTELGA